jgi:NAD(P)-dependent dehydrogenase (short-subunit alcohol dehydrogenase family)
MNWSGHVAIVTGAGSGIGQGVAECFAEAGAEVVLAELGRQRGEAVAEDLQNRFGKGVFIQTDVSKPSDCKAVVQYAMETYGRVDTLVNNAGVNFVKPTLEMDVDDWERVLNVDLRGTFLCSRYTLEVMAQQRSGNIVNIASVHTQSTLPEAAPYAAAKCGVLGLTRALAIEFAPYGIRVNAVSPGLTDTQIWQDIQNVAEDPAEARRHWFDNIPMGRVQSAREVGNVVLFLASDQSSYITGANIMTDGGMTAQLTSRTRYASKPLEGKA